MAGGDHRRGLISLAAAICITAACASPEDRLSAHLERGEAYLQDGDGDAALLEFGNALKLRPDDPELFEKIAETLETETRLAEALRYYEQSYQLDPSRTVVAMKIANLIAFSDRDRALALVEQALESSPDLAIVHRSRSHLALNEGDTATAREAADRALELDPEDPRNWAELGTAYRGRIRELQLLGRPIDDTIFEGAVAAYEKVDELMDGAPLARLEKAMLLAAWPGHQKLALAEFETTLSLAKEREKKLEVLYTARAQAHFAEAIRDDELRTRALREIIDADPGDYEAWGELARLSGGDAGSSPGAIYEELVNERPDDARAHHLLAAQLVRERRFGAAIEHLERAVDEVAAPSLRDTLLRLQIHAGRIADARTLLARMRDEAPDSFVTRLAGARVALAEARLEDAIETLEELATERVGDAEIRRLMALVQLRRGEYLSAVQAIEEAIRLTSGSRDALERIHAQIAFEAGMWRRVVEVYRSLIDTGRVLSADETVRLAKAMYHAGMPLEARKLLQKVLKLPAANSEAAIAFARYEGRRRYREAHTHLVVAHRRARADVDVLEALTTLEARNRRGQESLHRLNQLVSAGLARPRTLLLRARLLVAKGDYNAAEADVLRALEVDPTLPEAGDLLFGIYQTQGTLEAARGSFEQADAAGLLHPGARLLLGRLYLAAGETQKARDALERVLREDPSIWRARNDLAWILAERGEELDRALALARSAHAASGRGANTGDTVGYVLLKAGRHLEALRSFRMARRAVTRDAAQPSPTLEYHTGLTLQALGQNQQAVDAFERALRGDLNFPEAEDARRRLEAAQHPDPDRGNPT